MVTGEKNRHVEIPYSVFEGRYKPRNRKIPFLYVKMLRKRCLRVVSLDPQKLACAATLPIRGNFCKSFGRRHRAGPCLSERSGCLVTTKPEPESLKPLLWLRELSVNPGEVLAPLRGNLIQVLSKMELLWPGADGRGKSHEISLNRSKAVSKVSSIYV